MIPAILFRLRLLMHGEAAILRHLSKIQRALERIVTQNDDVLALVDTLGTDVTSMRESLTGISSDVTDLKAQIAALPVGQPLDQATVDALTQKVNDVSDVTDAFASLDSETTQEPADPAPAE